MANRSFALAQLDVFTNRPLEGNQLAVFPDATGLSSDEMQRLAREMNFSETTFILPRDAATEEREGVKVRIFTVAEELPFAGHPTLGTAWYLHRQTRAEQIVLDLKVGKIPVHFEDRDGLAFGEMNQVDPEFGAAHSPAEVARVLGVPVSDLDASLPIQSVSTGMWFTIVPFRSLATLQKLQVSWSQMADYLQGVGGNSFFYLVCRETSHASSALHARMIFYNGEDPATGSAAGCCAAWAVRHGVFAPDAPAVIEQGIEMLRPSFLHVRAGKHGDRVTNVRVGGHTVQVVDGRVTM